MYRCRAAEQFAEPKQPLSLELAGVHRRHEHTSGIEAAAADAAAHQSQAEHAKTNDQRSQTGLHSHQPTGKQRAQHSVLHK